MMNNVRDILAAEPGRCVVVTEDKGALMGKVTVVTFIPTAEELARHWYRILKGPVRVESKFRAHLSSVEVYETPNCSAEYPG